MEEVNCHEMMPSKELREGENGERQQDQHADRGNTENNERFLISGSAFPGSCTAFVHPLCIYVCCERSVCKQP